MVAFMRKILRRFRSPPDNFALGSGAQRSVDTHRLFLNSAKFYAGLRRDERLTLFESIKDTVPLAAGALQVLCKMVNTRMVPQSGDPAVDARMREIWEQINGHSINSQLIYQGLTFGFSVGEISWNDATLEIEPVKVLRSLQVRKRVDRLGDVTAFLQFASPPAPGATRGLIEIPPHKVIDFVHLQEDAFDYYGNSIFASAVSQLEAVCEVLQASINVFNRIGKPRFNVEINAEGLTPEQFQDRIEKTKQVFSSLATGEDIYTPAGTKVTVIGSEVAGTPMEQESRLLVSHILSALGVPPALLHLQQGGSTESYTRQVIISLQQLLTNIQTSAAAAWNQGFWRLIQRLEGMVTIPKIGFEQPRLLEQLMEERARQARFSNNLKETMFGVRPPEWLAQQCGVVAADDEKVLREMIDKARESFDANKEINNPETNRESTTKSTDERASSNTTA